MAPLSTFFSVYGFYLWLSTTLLFFCLYGTLYLRFIKTVAGYRNLLSQVDKNNLLQILESNLGVNATTKQEISSLQAAIRNIEAHVQKSIRKVGVVRYQAFRESGGDQSFSIALLDGNNNGLVLTGIHSRADMRIFSKPVTQGQSSFPLSEEEGEAIVRAIKAEEVATAQEADSSPQNRSENRPRSGQAYFQ